MHMYVHCLFQGRNPHPMKWSRLGAWLHCIHFYQGFQPPIREVLDRSLHLLGDGFNPPNEVRPSNAEVK